MVLDRLAARPDGARAEHAVVTGDPEDVWPVVLEADFLRAVSENRLVSALFRFRSAAERAAAAASRRPFAEPPEPESLRLAGLPTHGDWVLLGLDRPREVAFGVIGRFWGGETAWEEIDADEFEGFARPGLAKIACNLSLRSYGAGRTIVSYEARTTATDAASRRSFLRYWRVVSPFVGVVMRSTLRVIAADARERVCAPR